VGVPYAARGHRQVDSPSVAIIVLNYQNAPVTVACVRSLRRLTYPNFHIFVVDNGSDDDSLEQFQRYIPEIDLVKTGANLGYAGGNNRGIEKAFTLQEFDYVWVVNNDLVVDTEALTHLVKTAEQYAPALVGPKVVWFSGEFQLYASRILTAGGLEPAMYQEHEVEEGQDLEMVAGSAMLIPRRALETVGLLDESYFMYMEDNAYCYRAKKAGFACVISPQAEVAHWGSATSTRHILVASYYLIRNSLRVVHEHGNWKLRLSRTVAALKFWLNATLSLWREPEPSKANRVKLAQKLGIEDFFRNKQGPCPHLDLFLGPKAGQPKRQETS